MLKSLPLITILLFTLTACQNKVQLQETKISGTQAEGLINAKLDSEFPGVVMLSGSALCTATLVGLNPPTLITAKHCVKMGATSFLSSSPETIVVDDFGKFNYDMADSQTPGDIAILIYPKELKAQLQLKPTDVFSVAPVSLQWQSPISICGYGASNNSEDFPADYGDKRCGQNWLITDNDDFAFGTFMRSLYKYKKDLPDYGYSHFLEADKIKFIHGAVQLDLRTYGSKTRYGIGSFTPDAFQANPAKGLDTNKQEALVNRGDSGGPWFIQTAGENPRLFAVSSLALGDNSTDNDVIAGIAWRLDHPWSVALMAKAVQQGADITGFQELQKTVSPQPTKNPK